MPSRQDIDPAEMVQLLPHLFMVDVETNPWRFRYRLVGTAIVEFTGRDLTGHSLDEGDYGEFTEAALQLFKGVVLQRVPFAVKGRAVWLPGRDWQDIELLCLPLGADENNPDIVLGGYIARENALAGESAHRVPAYERLRVIPRPKVG